MRTELGNGVREMHSCRLPVDVPRHVREGIHAPKGLLSCEFFEHLEPPCADLLEVIDHDDPSFFAWTMFSMVRFDSILVSDI